MIVIAFFQQLAVLSSAFFQLHGLLYLFLLYRKRNIDLLVTHFAWMRNLLVKRCKELNVRRLQRKQRTRWGQRRENRSMVAKHVLMRITGRRLEEIFPTDKTTIRRPLRTTGTPNISRRTRNLLIAGLFQLRRK